MKPPLLLTLAIFIMVSTVGITARATPNFPPEIQTHLGLQDSPACALCHNGDPGVGTATTPFATNMKSRGLAAFDLPSLDAALDKMAADHVSSIGDCLDDIDELKAGNDPNQPDPPGTCEDAGVSAGGGPSQTASLDSPRYGCVGSISPTRADGASSALMVAAALLFSRRRRRRGAR